VENGAVPLTIDEIEKLLQRGAARPVEISDAHGARVGEMPHSQLDHALQTAAMLREWSPDDSELQVAGLVHDIGQLVDGVGDADHAEVGAAEVRGALGERVAALVGLHVEAKRYLVATEGGYGGGLAADSVASLALQGGPMSAHERTEFERGPHFDHVILLRRADESAKVDGLVVEGLAEWMDVVHRVHTHGR
jgi:predicted HD phosphohydrolase